MRDLEILEERVLVAIPRGDDELRLSLVRGLNAEAREIWWASLRQFYRLQGEWRPGRAGLTIRSRELPAIAAALSKLAAGAPVQAEGERAPTRHRVSHGRQTSLPVAPAPIPDGEIVDDEGIF